MSDAHYKPGTREWTVEEASTEEHRKLNEKTREYINVRNVPLKSAVASILLVVT